MKVPSLRPQGRETLATSFERVVYYSRELHNGNTCQVLSAFLDRACRAHQENWARFRYMVEPWEIQSEPPLTRRIPDDSWRTVRTRSLSSEWVRPEDAPYTYGTFSISEQCPDCGACWRRWPDGPRECELCAPPYPRQPKPFAHRLTDPRDYLGPDWIWSNWVDLRGAWVPLKDFILIRVEDWREAMKILSDGGIKLDPGRTGALTQLARLAVGKKDP